jgi:hypothetical protein
MKTKHTQGEWKILWGNYTHFATINADCTHRICALEVNEAEKWRIPSNEQIANAKLIAAAPDLLNACDSVLTAWHNKLSNMHKKEPLYLQQIRNVIKKATE